MYGDNYIQLVFNVIYIYFYKTYISDSKLIKKEKKSN